MIWSSDDGPCRFGEAVEAPRRTGAALWQRFVEIYIQYDRQPIMERSGATARAPRLPTQSLGCEASVTIGCLTTEKGSETTMLHSPCCTNITSTFSFNMAGNLSLDPSTWVMGRSPKPRDWVTFKFQWPTLRSAWRGERATISQSGMARPQSP